MESSRFYRTGEGVGVGSVAKRGRKTGGVRRRRDMDSFREANPSSFSAALVEETKALWEPYYGRSLSDYEARELLANVCNFFHVLMIAKTQADNAGD